MKRFLLLTASLAFLAGCVVHQHLPPQTYEPAAPQAYVAPAEPAPAPQPYYQPPPQLEVWYHDSHFVPESLGGGWCYLDGPHVHDYYPDRLDWYVQDYGYYWYTGPYHFSYYDGHPLPGGGWCNLRRFHRHDYAPPRGSDFSWRAGDRAYFYVGSYRPNRPPPRNYWVAPAPPPRRIVPARPAPAPAPTATIQGALNPRLPAPGHGNVPPGQGGTPPGLADRLGSAMSPPASRTPAPVAPTPVAPGASGFAPGHGNVPPGQGGTPPGQAARPGQAQPSPAAAPAASPSAAPKASPARAQPEKKKDKKSDDDDEVEKKSEPKGRRSLQEKLTQ